MKHLTAAALAILFGCLWGGCATPGERGSGRARPNVLFIAVDDLRPELGCYGVEHAITPNIDRLARRGVVFTRLQLRTELEGSSFAPLLADRHGAWKTAAFTQFLREGIWVAPDGVEYMGRSIRTERYRYVEWRRWHDADEGGPRREEPDLVARELYDHETDPLETINVADRPERATVCDGLALRLRAGWRAER